MIRKNNYEEEKLTQLLESDSSVRSLLQEMPEETVSMQWRSALNERLLALAPAKKKISAFVVGMRAIVGIGVASAVCVALLYKPQAPRQNQVVSADPSSFASALISEHRQSVVSSEIAGPGIVDGETEAAPSQDSTSDDLDSESL